MIYSDSVEADIDEPCYYCRKLYCFKCYDRCNTCENNCCVNCNIKCSSDVEHEICPIR